MRRTRCREAGRAGLRLRCPSRFHRSSSTLSVVGPPPPPLVVSVRLLCTCLSKWPMAAGRHPGSAAGHGAWPGDGGDQGTLDPRQGSRKLRGHHLQVSSAWDSHHGAGAPLAKRKAECLLQAKVQPEEPSAPLPALRALRLQEVLEPQSGAHICPTPNDTCC